MRDEKETRLKRGCQIELKMSADKILISTVLKRRPTLSFLGKQVENYFVNN